MGINVISFFDGISAGQQALKSLGVEVDNYIAIEIDPIAKSVTRKNFPNTIFWGDITQLEESQEFYESLPKIDLVFGGSPCQGLSRAGKRKGLKDIRSSLFHSFVFIFNQIKKDQKNPHLPFFFENVVMTGDMIGTANEFSIALGVPYTELDAIDFSPCKRDRFYWTNIGIPSFIINKFKGNKETYMDVMSKTIERKNILPANMNTVTKKYMYEKSNSENKPYQINKDGFLYNTIVNGKPKVHQSRLVFRTNSKMPCFTAISGGWGAQSSLYLRKSPKSLNLQPGWGAGYSQSDRVFMPYKETVIVKPSVEACLKAMGFPQNYFDGVDISETQKREAIGNSWSIQAVSLLLRSLLIKR